MPSIKDTKGQRQLLENTAVVSVTGIRIPLGVHPSLQPLELLLGRRSIGPNAYAFVPKETAFRISIGESSLVDRVSCFARFCFHFFFKRRPDT